MNIVVIENCSPVIVHCGVTDGSETANGTILWDLGVGGGVGKLGKRLSEAGVAEDAVKPEVAGGIQLGLYVWGKPFVVPSPVGVSLPGVGYHVIDICSVWTNQLDSPGEKHAVIDVPAFFPSLTVLLKLTVLRSNVVSGKRCHAIDELVDSGVRIVA